MPFMLRTCRRFPVHCTVTTTPGPSKAEARSGISPVPAGDPRLSRTHCEIVIRDSIPSASFDLELIGNPGSP